MARAPWGTYRRIAEDLRERVTNGEPMPSESELCRQHGVSRTTVRRALRVLEAEHLVYAVPGVGRTDRAPDPRPRYVLVAEDLRARITSGELPAGSRLPSESELADEHGVSRGTARAALGELQASGLVRAVHGVGRLVL